MFLIYRTDVWHTFKSRELMAVCTTQKNVIKICKAIAEREDTKLTNDDLYNLTHLKQTQGYAGNGELIYEEVSKNAII